MRLAWIGRSVLPWCILFFLPAAHPAVSKTSQEIVLERSPCPSLLGCKCEKEDPLSLICTAVGSSIIDSISTHYPTLRNLSIHRWTESELDLRVFKNLTSLQGLEVADSVLKSLFIEEDELLPMLVNLSLDGNGLSNWTQICSITSRLPSLRILSLSRNAFQVLVRCPNDGRSGLKFLNLSMSKVSSIEGPLPPSLDILDLSHNELTSVAASVLPSNLIVLSLASNPLGSDLSLPVFPQLRQLNLSGTPSATLNPIHAPALQKLYLDQTRLEWLDLTSFETRMLSLFSLGSSSSLSFIHGQLPSSIRTFTLTGSRVASLPHNFFQNTDPAAILSLGGNSFICDGCFLQWTRPVLNVLKQIGCSSVPLDCPHPKVSVANVTRVRNEESALIPCHSSDEESVIEWWRFRPSAFIGSFDPSSNTITRGSNHSLNMEVVMGGALSVASVTRDVVERYVCVARPPIGNSSHAIGLLRLDFSFWYSLDILESVFWGCLMAAAVACAASFLLNITWILSRKSILWWIQRAERLSRVRKMVEAMEKYRQKQMEAIHDNYHKRVSAVRDTYHQQVEQLRGGYTSQVERFRDYRTAQIENVQAHLETLRENYQQQIQKVRDYGARRAEALWESYEKQMNRVRMFNLQSRLKMMRQYNLKQRYINKLFENFQRDIADPEAIRKHEEEVRAALDLPDPTVPELRHLSRSSSFYSLPEYVMGEDGNLRPSPLVGSSPPLQLAPFGRRRRFSQSERSTEVKPPEKDRSPSPQPGPSNAP